MLIAFVAFATRLPCLLCAIPAVVIADRYDHKSLIAAADLVRMIFTTGFVVCSVSVPQPVAEGTALAAILIVSGLAFLL